jgi:hypothetical protein
MPELILLLAAILMLSGAIAYWLRGTALSLSGLRYIYAVVTSLVIISTVYDALLIVHAPMWLFLSVSLSMSIGLLYYQWQQSGYERLSLRVPEVGVYSLLVLAALYYVSLQFLTYSVRWGKTDARAIWSLHALFLTYPHGFANMFTNTIAWSHPDYPQMLSSWIAMCWRSMGSADALVPCVIAYTTLIAVLITVSLALRGTGRYLLGISGLMAFIFARSYSEMPSFQGADALFSFFVLLSFVLARLGGQSARLFLLMGFITGFSGWVKNEGIAFIIIFSLGILWANRKSPGLFIHYCLGLILPVFIIILYKLTYAPVNDIVAGQNLSVLSRLTDIERYRLTAEFFISNARGLYPILLAILILIVLVRGYKRLFDIHLLLVVAMLIAYFFIFIITPRELHWHLQTASARLFLQLYPAFVFVLLSILGDQRTADQR